MTHDHVTTPLSPGQRLAQDVCRDLGLNPSVAYLSRALIDALAKQRGWSIVVRPSTPAEEAQWLLRDITGTITPVRPNAWEVVVLSGVPPRSRELTVLALLAPLLRGVVPPEGYARHGQGQGRDELIGDDFARTLTVRGALADSLPATPPPAPSPPPSFTDMLIPLMFPIIFLMAAISEVFHH